MKLRQITSVMAATALAVLGCAAVMSTSRAGATTSNTSFTASEDSYTSENNATGTHGTVPLAVNATSTFPDRRWTFVKFIVSGLPAGAVVSSFPYLGTNFTGGYNLRLNLQVGQPSYYGDPNASTDFSQQYQVDYVRVWGS